MGRARAGDRRSHPRRSHEKIVAGIAGSSAPAWVTTLPRAAAIAAARNLLTG